MQIWLVDQFRRLVRPENAKLISLENGEDRTDATLGLLARLGVEDGVTDLALIMTRGRIAWIEVKLESTLRHARTGPSEDQKAWHAALELLGHRCWVVRNAAEFWAVVDHYHVPHDLVPVRVEQLLLPRPRRRPQRKTTVTPQAL